MQSSLIYFITRCTHSFEVPVKVSWTVVVPTFGMNEFTTSNPKSTMAVAMTATIYMPVPQDSPMAAVTHNPAAVVSPRTTFLLKMMVPAPKKPIPETTCAATREEDVHIVIFPCGKPNAKRWAAIGQDADRLFEVFGWQTGHVNATNGPVSWMFINGYGLDVLRQSGYSIQIRDFGEFDILSTAFEEDSVASLQQFIDYMRMMDKLSGEQIEFLRKIRPVIYPHPGYWELTHGNLVFSKDNVVAEFDNGNKVTLAQGKNWRMHELFRPMFLEMGAEFGEA